MSRERQGHTHGVRLQFQDSGGDRGVGDLYEYVIVNLEGGLRHIPVHKVIAFAHGMIDFDEFCNPDVVVHHESEHGLDNRPENLEPMSRREHSIQHKLADPNTKLDFELADELRRRYESENITQQEIADDFGVSKSTAQKVIQNRRWVRDDVEC